MYHLFPFWTRQYLHWRHVSTHHCLLKKENMTELFLFIYFFRVFLTFLSDLISKHCLLPLQLVQVFAVTALQPRVTVDKILQQSAVLTPVITVRLGVKKIKMRGNFH